MDHVNFRTIKVSHIELVSLKNHVIVILLVFPVYGRVRGSIQNGGGPGAGLGDEMSLQSYKELTKEELENIPSDCKQAAHTMIYTKMDKKLFELYPIMNTVMVSTCAS